MGTRIIIPKALRKLTRRRDSVFVQGRTVGELLNRLSTLYPRFRKILFSHEGHLDGRVSILLNNEDIQYIENEATQVTPHDRVSILPKMVG